MLLAIDVGNTNLKFGLFDGARLVARWRLATQRQQQSDELAMVLLALLRESGLRREHIRAAAIASVVPALTSQVMPLCEQWLGVTPLLVAPGVAHGLTVDGRPLDELGADRIVQCLGALERHPQGCCVVALGTATVFDMVGGGGSYLGGCIAPGLKTSADALYAKAALLREVPLQAPAHALARTTTAQLQAGLVLGWAGLIDGLVGRMQGESRAGDLPVVATGGLAELISPHSKTIREVEPDLALHGLRQLHTLQTR